MSKIKLEEIFQPFYIQDLDLIDKIRAIKNLIEELEDETQLSKYIINELLTPKGIRFSIHFEEDSKVSRVKISKYGIIFYIDHSSNDVIYIPRNKNYEYAHIERAIRYVFDTWIKDISSLNIYFKLGNFGSVMSRDLMIILIKKYPYIPFTHSYFDEDEFIYSKKDGNVYEEHGYLFEDWDSEEFNGIRYRSEGEWEVGWRTYDLENWYDKLRRINNYEMLLSRRCRR